MKHPEPPKEIFWVTMEHPCGCFIDWGVAAQERDRLYEFLPTAAPYPCPWHGSATGVASTVSRGGVGCIVANNVWYRQAPSDQEENGRRNRLTALDKSRGVPVKKSTEIEEVKVAMARHAPVLDLPVIPNADNTTLVLDVQRVATRLPLERLAWVETSEGELFRLPESLLNWAFDTVASVLASGGNDRVGLFPARIEFGVSNGNAYAHFL